MEFFYVLFAILLIYLGIKIIKNRRKVKETELVIGPEKKPGSLNSWKDVKEDIEKKDRLYKEWEAREKKKKTSSVPVYDKYPTRDRVDEPDNNLMTGVIIGSMLSNDNSPKYPSVAPTHSVTPSHSSHSESHHSSAANDNSPSSPSHDNSSSYSTDSGGGFSSGDSGGSSGGGFSSD